ncbi:MAG: nitrogen fixation protein NifH [Candidatus Thorarchaeota archaeon]|nr:MAG: nitrogen fixation protein NifH [Candidatus Thorarchaeota archaeon]
MDPTSFLQDDVIEWLLEPSNPSVRFWTLQQILDKSPTDKEVIEAQNAVMQSDCVKRFLDVQDSDGFWGKREDMYNPKYRATTHNLLILAELGAKRTPEMEKALEHVFLYQRESGHFLISLPKTEKGRASVVKDGCCIDGNILYYMVHFGYVDDPRVKALIDFQVDYYDTENEGWLCRAFPIDQSKVYPVNCYMGAVKVLKGLSRIPKSKLSSKVQDIINRYVEAILENEIYKYLKNPDGTRKEKAGWKRFGFPIFYQSDVLEVLDILTELGVKDERMQESIDFVLANRGKDGKWLLRNTFNGKMLCDIEEKGKASKWITLRALRGLKRFYS